MKVDYNKLWYLLDIKSISKKEFREKTKIGSSTYTQLLHNKNVSTASLIRICEYLNCQISDIVEAVD